MVGGVEVTQPADDRPSRRLRTDPTTADGAISRIAASWDHTDPCGTNRKRDDGEPGDDGGNDTGMSIGRVAGHRRRQPAAQRGEDHPVDDGPDRDEWCRRGVRIHASDGKEQASGHGERQVSSENSEHRAHHCREGIGLGVNVPPFRMSVSTSLDRLMNASCFSGVMLLWSDSTIGTGSADGTRFSTAQIPTGGAIVSMKPSAISDGALMRGAKFTVSKYSAVRMTSGSVDVQFG